MNLTTIRNNFISRHNLIRQANIGDETQVSLLDAATLTLFQDEVGSLLKLDYPVASGVTPVGGTLIKQCSNINVQQRKAIDGTFAPLSDPFNFALVGPAKQVADQVFGDSVNELLKSSSMMLGNEGSRIDLLE